MTTFYIRIEGDTDVGKSALLASPAKQRFTETYTSHTDEFLLSDSKAIEVTPVGHSEPVTLMIETAKPVEPNQTYDMVIYAFELDKTDNLVIELRKRKQLADERKKAGETVPPLFVVGCKADLVEGETKHKNLARRCAEELGFTYWETSSQDSMNTTLLFRHIATCLDERKSLSVNEFLKREGREDVDLLERNKREKADKLERSFQTIINKLKPGETAYYKNITELFNDASNINTIFNNMKSGLEFYVYKKKEDEYRKALVGFLISREDVLLMGWKNRELIQKDYNALQCLISYLEIIKRPTIPGEKITQKNSMQVAMDIEDKLKLLLYLLQLKESKDSKNERIYLKCIPSTAMTLLSSAQKLDNEMLDEIVNKCLLNPIGTYDAQEERFIKEWLKENPEHERKKLKERLIQYTEYQIEKSRAQPTEAYKKLCDDKDNANSNIPLIYILRTSATGKLGAKTTSYDDWLRKINASLAKAPEKKETISHPSIDKEAVKKQEKEKADQVEKSFLTFINKLKPGETRYQSIAELAADIKDINSITEQLTSYKYKKKRAEYRKALVDFLKSQEDALVSDLKSEEFVRIEACKLNEITENLKIIQSGGNEWDHAPLKKSMLVAMDVSRTFSSHSTLVTSLKKMSGEKNIKPDPQIAIEILANTPRLNKQLLMETITIHLIPPIELNDNGATNDKIRFYLQSITDAKRIQLKERLIQYTQDQIEQSTEQPTEAYTALCDDKDNANSNIPLIYILRTSGSGKVGAKTASYDTWLKKINASIAERDKLAASKTKIEESQLPEAKDRESFDKSGKADQLDKSFETFINKLKPGETRYQSIAELADDVDSINQMTAQLKPDKYKKMRAKYRDALVEFLNWRTDSLLTEWSDESLIENERKSLLNKIIIDLEIINAPKSEKITREKKSMQVALNIEDTLLLHNLNMSPMKILESSTEAKPQLAISVLARSPKLDDDRLCGIITKHLIPSMTEKKKLKAPLEKQDKERLNERLIHYTKIQIYVSTSNKTDAYKALFNDKDNAESNIPLIHMLRLSDSGKTGEKTGSYVSWLSAINASVSKPIASVVSSLVKNGVFGVNDEILEQERIKRLLPFGEDRDAIANGVFSIEEKPKKK